MTPSLFSLTRCSLVDHGGAEDYSRCLYLAIFSVGDDARVEWWPWGVGEALGCRLTHKPTLPSCSNIVKSRLSEVLHQTNALMNEAGFLRFEGKDASEAEEFIRSINIKAFTANKSKDDEWIAMLAGTAFTSQALRWYRTLSPSIRDSWDGLQNALLQYYQPSRDSYSPSVLTAPAASPPTRDATSPTQSRTGRIKIRSQSSTLDMVYLCGDLSFNGVYTWTRDINNALTVRHSPTAHTLEVMSGDVAQCYIGAQFWDNSTSYSNLASGGRGYLEITPVRATSVGYTSSLKFRTGRPGEGEIFVTLWSVAVDGALLPVIAQNGVRYCLTACVFTDSQGLALASDFVSFLKRWHSGQIERLDLMFEPL